MSTTYDATLARIARIPLGAYRYSQSVRQPLIGDRRADCSGWASYCWNLPTTGPGTWLGAYSTASLFTQGLIAEIPFGELRPGDAIGYCGPTTANGGGGHIAIWMGGDRTALGRHHVSDHGSGMGPKRRTVQWDGRSTGWLHPNKLRAWRYVHMEGSALMFCSKGDTGDAVKALQAVLVNLGRLAEADVDGVYGSRTAAALRRQLNNPNESGETYGPWQYAAVMRSLGALGSVPVDVAAIVNAEVVSQLAQLRAEVVFHPGGK